ncbi:hypothetical protein O2N63_12750 [Aliiroseovarius sp. KMU-50]|uniref:DUF3576 domain-containing protein n=1 Tax=Aliiroseovarius salicola TaxID=3009082 RepID=A0ABT4W383_9RHOB|nr:hypothetical protein [Aliiroseovarius sp. KMU-50]MDA5094955.1 hypothetical protein [Aliiroseovarius sp. KMU-50]
MRLSARFLAFPALFIALSGCGGGSASLNPTTWFSSPGPKGVAVVPEGGFSQDLDGRFLVNQVTELKVLETSGGVILSTKGLPPRLGYWDADLVAQNDGKPVNGVLIYDFRISEPAQHTNTGIPQQREVYVGQFISDHALRDVRSIQVKGAGNTMSARR